MLKKLILFTTFLPFLQFAVTESIFGKTVQEGIQYYNAKRFQEAETTFRDVLRAEPNNAQAHYTLGLTLLELQRFAEAADEFSRADKLTPPSNQVRMVKVESSALRRDDIKIGLARAYMGQKQFDKAKIALDEAQQIRSDNPDIYHYRGMLNSQRGDYVAATSDFEGAIKLNPKNAYSYYYAGLAYNKLKRPDKMVQHFETFLKLAPNAPEAGKVRALLSSIR
jgi:tetratricopeptide (TPR) repeat protein